MQGVVRPGLLSLRERYRLRGRELAEDGLVLAEQLDAAREANAERLEELAALRRQVGGVGTAAAQVVVVFVMLCGRVQSPLVCGTTGRSGGLYSLLLCPLQLVVREPVGAASHSRAQTPETLPPWSIAQRNVPLCTIHAVGQGLCSCCRSVPLRSATAA